MNYAMARIESSDVLWKYYDTGTGWSSWQNLSNGVGDPSFGGPVAINNHGSGGIYVTAVSSGSVWFKKYVSGSGWSGWTNLGYPSDGAINGSISLAYDPSQPSVRVVAVRNGTVYFNYSTGGSWSGWQNLGGSGTITGAVAVGARNGLIHIAGQTPSNAHVWLRWWNGSDWYGWQDLGGTLDATLAIDNSSAVSGNTGSTHTGVHIISTSSQYVKLRCWESYCGSGWESHSNAYSGPLAVSNNNGEVHMVARSSSNLYHRWRP